MKDFFLFTFLKKNDSIILGVLFWGLVCSYLIVRVIFLVGTNYTMVNGEANNVWNILQVVNGRSLYVNPTEIPFEIFQYAPIAQLIYIGIVSLFHIENIQTIFIVCRLISLIWNGVAAVAIYMFIRYYAPEQKKTYALWLSFLSLFILTFLNWTVRVDSCSTTMMALTIIFSLLYLKEARIIYCILSSFLLAIACFSKQDGIQLLAILPFAMLCTKYYKQSALFLLFSVLFLGILFEIFILIYGDVFIQNVIGGVRNPISFSQMFYVFNRYFQFYSIFPFIVLLIAGYIVMNEKASPLTYLACVVFGLFIFAIGISSKAGSGMNYFTIFNIAGIILLGMFSVKFYKEKKTWFGVTYLSFAFYFFSGYMYHYILPMLDIQKEKLREVETFNKELQSNIPKDAYIYTEDVYLKLQLWNQTIFPNSEYYGVSPYRYSESCGYKKNLYIIKNREADYRFIYSIINIDEQKLENIAQKNGYVIYKYTTDDRTK